MLNKEDFIRFILEGPKQSAQASAHSTKTTVPSGGLMAHAFDIPDEQSVQTDGDFSFAQRLLEASDLGKPDYVQTTSLIRSTDSVAQHLPSRASYWPKTQSRPYQTLLFETNKSHKDLLAIPAFKSRKMSHLDIVEDALARMVSEALEGFKKGGEVVRADVRKGKKEETLCLVSVRDERELQSVRLVCFGTVNAKTGGLETFHLTEQTRFWEPQLAKDHLGLLYERQFKKLGSANWQEAFTTSEEREQAEKLLKVCSKKSPLIKEIQENVLLLLDTIAKGFGLRKKPGHTLRMQAFDLPADHDIGIDPEELTSMHAGKNPFGGITLRDEKNRLLGYIVYPLKKKEDATKLRSYLEKNNRFHNVLVVFPDGEETTLELWQGMEQLSGKLHKGKGFEGAAEVVSLLSRFFVVSKAKVRNPTELAQELAYRARYLRRLAVKELETEKTDGPLRDLYKAFKSALVHDQTEEDFADAFAQTITYGLLTSRWIGNDKLAESGDRFTRQNALKYLPETSNFLGDLFKTALSVKLDDQRGRLLWLVDDIADLLDRIDVSYVFGIGDKDSDQATDPVIHFYEPFLAAYDNELRNKRGVYFTPRPVVIYIVRSVHELLQDEFGLEDGLASTASWGDVQKKFSDLRLPDGVKASDPFVCILDPATGTGTFLYECIEVIERTMKEKWCKELKRNKWDDPVILARWQEYVPKHLLTRLYGYELMMASYSIAHLKLAFKLRETGYLIKNEERLHIYLTNSLEPPSDDQQILPGVMLALAKEAKEVNEIKRNIRFTVFVGNPPYSLLSANLEAHHRAMIEPYKFIRGERIYERSALQLEKNLNDDYVKFIRLCQMCMDLSSIGVSGLITNHSFLDNPTMRGLRWALIDSSTRIWVNDLHGNSTKKEQSPGEDEDANVFQIKQGVAITLLARLSTSSGCSAFHHECWGSREHKETWLRSNSLRSHKWQELEPTPDLYLFIPQNSSLKSEFEGGMSLPEVMPVNGAGYITARDNLVIDFEQDELLDRILRFNSSRLSDASLLKEFDVSDKKGWDLVRARKILKHVDITKRIIMTNYRPFDSRWIFFDSTLVWGRSWPTMQHVVGDKGNITLLATRMTKDQWDVWPARTVSSHKAMSAYDTNSVFPLYLTDDVESSQKTLTMVRRVNLSAVFLKELATSLNIAQKGVNGLPQRITPEDIFNYIYAVFRSPGYRSRYSEFLKNEFPRLPLPRTLKLFQSLSMHGGELVALHLLESPKVKRPITVYVGPKNPEVVRIVWSNDAVWLDSPVAKKGHPPKPGNIGFKGITEQVWNFHIGGYQVCEKWLKDRKGLTLSAEDIAHYQKIIVSISETIRLMTEIDKVIDAHGGWPGAFQIGTEGAK